MPDAPAFLEGCEPDLSSLRTLWMIVSGSLATLAAWPFPIDDCRVLIVRTLGVLVVRLRSVLGGYLISDFRVKIGDWRSAVAGQRFGAAGEFGLKFRYRRQAAFVPARKSPYQSRPPFGHADGLLYVSERLLDDELVLGGAEQDAD
jgi:hypothetical protein